MTSLDSGVVGRCPTPFCTSRQVSSLAGGASTITTLNISNSSTDRGVIQVFGYVVFNSTGDVTNLIRWILITFDPTNPDLSGGMYKMDYGPFPSRYEHLEGRAQGGGGVNTFEVQPMGMFSCPAGASTVSLTLFNSGANAWSSLSIRLNAILFETPATVCEQIYNPIDF